MDLLEIRQDFIELSGRADLAETRDDSEDDCDLDTGADRYIQAALKTLDSEQDSPVSEAHLVRTINAGDYLISFRGVKSVSQVWIDDGTDGLVELDRYNMTDMRYWYPKLGDTDIGTPAYYAPYPVVSPVEQRVFGLPVDFTGIYLMPPSDATFTVTVVGMFQCVTLEHNHDTNFWSVMHPDILIQAAIRELEFSYRNTAGAKDSSIPIDLKLRGVDKDLVQRELDSHPLMTMEG